MPPKGCSVNGPRIQCLKIAFLSPCGSLGPRGTSLVAQTVKHLPTMRETWVRSLRREDPLEEGMATHPSTLACRTPWTEEPGGLQSLGSQSRAHGVSCCRCLIPSPRPVSQPRPVSAGAQEQSQTHTTVKPQVTHDRTQSKDGEM